MLNIQIFKYTLNIPTYSGEMRRVTWEKRKEKREKKKREMQLDASDQNV